MRGGRECLGLVVGGAAPALLAPRLAPEASGSAAGVEFKSATPLLSFERGGFPCVPIAYAAPLLLPPQRSPRRLALRAKIELQNFQKTVGLVLPPGAASASPEATPRHAIRSAWDSLPKLKKSKLHILLDHRLQHLLQLVAPCK